MNDCVYRQAAIDIADDMRDSISVEEYWAWTERLKKLPSAEVEPVKRGRWIIKDDSFTYGIIRAVHWYECSNCGGIAYVEHPYCPHCGAKMNVAEM